MKKRISVVGASGYTGMEFIRWLLLHPQMELSQVYGHSSAGKSYASVYPAFEGIVHQQIKPMEDVLRDEADAVVFALPHKESALWAGKLIEAGFQGKLVDLGSDFRLANTTQVKEWYGFEHPCPQHLSAFQYGLTEVFASELSKAKYVANPGCFASALQLGIWPLLKHGITGPFYVTGVTGSSGSGATPSEATHFSSRFGNMKAYKVLEHQHMGEVLLHLERATGMKPKIQFTPVSGSFVRGIWVTIQLEVATDIDVAHLFQVTYAGASLVRLRSQLPELKHVVGSAYTDIGLVQKGSQVVVGVAIDNLGKGAATQAIQNLNILFGWPDATGLTSVGVIL